jgi:preprotein translocase subunit SecG
VNPFLSIGQIVIGLALMAAILLQARGTGLSGTFGGDSAVYRSRRGVERRLWQFTRRQRRHTRLIIDPA